MSRYQGSNHSGSSSSSRSSSSSSSVSYHLGDDHLEGAVTRHPNKNHRFPFRFAAHVLRGPHAAEKSTHKKGHRNSHRRGRSPSPASVRRAPTGPRPAPVIYHDQNRQQAYRQPQQAGPPPPPPGMMKPGGFGPGSQGFVQTNGNGRGVPPAKMPGSWDPIWGLDQQNQQQHGARRAQPPYPTSPTVVLMD
ncbi:hypothetical protein BJ166DRAFT_492746 [Pestalotiopsis sp. NC0098]|nr:hypothetical protein BJ166DRAFT_492746 [Pestalotiopsis sp. NC0098]